jgi:hypothetical protein
MNRKSIYILVGVLIVLFALYLFLRSPLGSYLEGVDNMEPIENEVAPAPTPAPGTNLILNGNFELPVTMSGSYHRIMADFNDLNNNYIPNWIGNGALINNSVSLGIKMPYPGGNTCYVIQSTQFIQQQISITANTKYVITFWASSHNKENPLTIQVSSRFETNVLETYTPPLDVWTQHTLYFTGKTTDNGFFLNFTGTSNDSNSLSAITGITFKEKTEEPTPAPTPTNPTPLANINGYDYVGCWGDNGSNRALKNLLSKGYNMEQCVNAAKQKGYDTAGLQYHGECWAGNQGVDGNDYKKYSQLSESDPNCNVTSPGGSTNVVYSMFKSAPAPAPVPTPVPTPEPTPTPVPVPTPTPVTTPISTSSYSPGYLRATYGQSSSNVPTTPTTESTSSSTPTPTQTPTTTTESTSSSTPTPTPTPTTSLFSPGSYMNSYLNSSNGSLPTLPTTYTRNVDNQQEPPNQSQSNSTMITFDPSSSSTTTITFSQVPSGSTPTPKTEEPVEEPVVSDTSTYYPYKSVYTTQPTAQQLLPYLSTNTPIKTKNQSNPLISEGGTYYYSSTPEAFSKMY